MFTKVLEEYVASIFKVEGCLSVCSSLPIEDYYVRFKALMEEVMKITIFYPEYGGNTYLQNNGNLLPGCQYCIPEDSNLHSHCHENYKSHITNSVCDIKVNPIYAAH
jgi:hypothetical protein